MHIQDLTRFLAELSEQNNRAWFMMNKPRYDILRAEFLALVTKLIADISKFDPEIASTSPKKALFRINRDMRFSRDKSPYKTTFSASILPHGRKKPSDGGGPAYYFHINAENTLLLAVGEYMPPSDRLRAVRNHIITDAAGFDRLLNNKELISTFGNLQEVGKLTRPPKGFEAEAPHIEQIKLKNFIVWKEISLQTQRPTSLGQYLAQQFMQGYPLVKWLRTVPQTILS